jgi:tetratricopeptide (TPR) repeat protein
MDSWLGCLLILAGVYLVVVVVRGILQLVSWFNDEFLSASRRQRRKETSRSPRSEAAAATVPAAAAPVRTSDEHGSYEQRMLASAARITLAHWLAAPLELARMLASSGKYDYWVASALAEDDPHKKVRYLTKALALNAGYTPAWGLKGNALFALQRYDEALECFEKVLATAPSALAWHEKGLCCHRLGRYAEAVQCFDKALGACADKGSGLRADALRNKRLAESNINRKEPA